MLTNAPLHLLLAAHCYGGMATTRFSQSLLDLEAACAATGVRLQISLSGGEALVSRARAGMVAEFLAGEATHLLLVDGDVAFAAGGVLDLLRSDPELAAVACDRGRGLLLSRAAAQRLWDGYPQLAAGLGDVRGGAARAVMMFDGIMAEDGRYLADMDALVARWRRLGGQVAGDEASVS